MFIRDADVHILERSDAVAIHGLANEMGHRGSVLPQGGFDARTGLSVLPEDGVPQDEGQP
jgi:hypothetical protein